MRNLLSNFSTIGILNIRQGILLMVRGTAVRALSARLLAALQWCASLLSMDTRDTQWHLPTGTQPVPVVCFAVVKQSRRRHVMCSRSVV